MMMPPSKLMTLCLIVSVVLVLVSPLVDLNPTALRAASAAMACLLALATLFVFSLLPSLQNYSKLARIFVVPTFQDSVDRTCTLLI
jgi:hypothetical protein